MRTKPLIFIIPFLAVGFWLGWTVKEVSLGFASIHFYGLVTMFATVWYAWLTHNLLKLNSEQNMAAKRMKFQSLQFTCRQILETLNTLPPPEGFNRDWLLSKPIWDSERLRDLEMLLPILDAIETGQGVVLVSILGWIQGLADELRKENLLSARAPYRLFNEAEWSAKLPEAKKLLELVLKETTKALRTQSA